MFLPIMIMNKACGIEPLSPRHIVFEGTLNDSRKATYLRMPLASKPLTKWHDAIMIMWLRPGLSIPTKSVEFLVSPSLAARHLDRKNFLKKNTTSV